MAQPLILCYSNRKLPLLLMGVARCWLNVWDWKYCYGCSEGRKLTTVEVFRERVG